MRHLFSLFFLVNHLPCITRGGGTAIPLVVARGRLFGGLGDGRVVFEVGTVIQVQ